MHILQIAGSGFYGSEEMGPVTSDIYNLTREFIKKGHKVTVIDIKNDIQRSKLLDEEFIEVDAIPRSVAALHKKTGKERFFKMWLNEYRFVKAVDTQTKKQRFDILMVHEYRTAFLLQLLFRKGLIYICHTWTPASMKRKKLGALYQVIHRWVVHHSTVTIALGEYIKDEMGRANVEVIPNGIQVQQFSSMDKKQARALLGFSESDFIVICVARIHHIKGIHVLIEAVQKLVGQIPTLRLLLVGSYSGSFNEREYVSDYTKDMFKKAEGLPVEFMGFVSNQSQKFQELMSASDLFVLPSIFEPQGLVVLEAMAMNLPVIASDVGGIRQMITPEVGYLFPLADADELANRIRHFYIHPDKIEEMSHHCRRHVETHFNWESAAEKYLQVLSKVANHA